jgi:hypothetical protein
LTEDRDSVTGIEESSTIDRLIRALEPRPLPAPGQGADVVYVLEDGTVTLVQVKHGVSDQPELESGQRHVDSTILSHAFAQALVASRERETALTTLARAALERLRDNSVSELIERLDKSVEELEAQRDHAVRVDGDREPYDPHEILKVLPGRYHDWFLADYRGALRAAYPAEGFLALTRMLRKWRLRAEKYAGEDYQRDLGLAQVARANKTRPENWKSAEEMQQRFRSQGRLP